VPYAGAGCLDYSLQYAQTIGMAWQASLVAFLLALPMGLSVLRMFKSDVTLEQAHAGK